MDFKKENIYSNKMFRCSLPIWATLLLCFSLFDNITDTQVTTQTSVPLLWRRRTTPVTTGCYQVRLLVQFTSLRDILTTDNTHVDLIDAAEKKCEEIHNKYFLDELEIMCPRKYNLYLVLGFIAAFQTISIGIGVAGVAMSVSNQNDIGKVSQQQIEHKEVVHALERQVNMNREKIKILQHNFNKEIQNYKNLEDDHNEIKDKLIWTIGNILHYQ
ncbi:unnamed protein product [Orchesella dallaii]|uniref:Uncharacterized protein n=1 Tax=Orchesella dallaii TaxID=48710 RepID=A0ABP1RJJ5_9HEXA